MAKDYYVVLRSDRIREFDDLYEGAIPDPIANQRELKQLLANSFGPAIWSENEAGEKTGVSSESEAKFSFKPEGGGAVRLLTIQDSNQERVQVFLQENGLHAIK